MAVPQPVPKAPVPVETVCAVARRWRISEMVAAKLSVLAAALPFGISIISGYRTPEEQDQLRAEGRPTAPNNVSTHLSCPATGVDVWPDIAVVNAVKATLASEAYRVGFRVGGGSAVDPETGIPSDWNHLDLGPRVP